MVTDRKTDTEPEAERFSWFGRFPPKARQKN